MWQGKWRNQYGSILTHARHVHRIAQERAAGNIVVFRRRCCIGSRGGGDAGDAGTDLYASVVAFDDHQCGHL